MISQVGERDLSKYYSVEGTTMKIGTSTEGKTIKHFRENVKRIPRADYTSEGLWEEG